MSLVSEVPSDYFRRFFNICCVIANGEIRDPIHFKSFLMGVEFLDILNLINPSLQQSWYDDLPDWCGRLRYIDLQEKEEIELNFDFLARLQLKRYELNRDLVLNSIQAVRVLFKGVTDFEFKFRGKKSRIKENPVKGRGRYNAEPSLFYDVLVDEELKLEKVSSMEALKHFDEESENKCEF